MNTKELLKKFSESPSTSGAEGSIANLIMKELKGKVAEIKKDGFGNVITRKGKGRPRVMISAHMDAIGLMVKYIDDQGFIKFAKVGGVDDQMLQNQRVVVHGKKEHYGVIGSKPIHLMTKEEQERLVKYDKMYIDAGFNSRKEAEKAGISVGDPISFDQSLVEIGNKVTGKSFDNRVGCTALIEIMKKAKPKCELYGVFTVQEEVGLRGAITSAYGVSPDIGIGLDVDLGGDSPGIEKGESFLELGKGPVICLASGAKGSLGGGVIADPRLKDWMLKAAKKAKVKHQISITEGGTTDSAAISLTKTGVPSITVGVPIRNMHTPVEVLYIKDLDDTVKLLVEALKSVPKL